MKPLRTSSGSGSHGLDAKTPDTTMADVARPDTRCPDRPGHCAGEQPRVPFDAQPGKRKRRRRRGRAKAHASKTGNAHTVSPHTRASDKSGPGHPGKNTAAVARHGDGRKLQERTGQAVRPADTAPNMRASSGNGDKGRTARHDCAETRAGKPDSDSRPARSQVHAHQERSGKPHEAAKPLRPRANAGYGGPFYAALDLGTNNCRLLVAQPTRYGEFRVVDAFSRIVRLGEGLVSTRRLSEAAMDRSIEALKVCAGKLAGRPLRARRLIATEACRAAENGELFLQRVRAETGLTLEVVDRETEARLAVSGCASLVESSTKGVVLFDIGGGSSEIAAIDLSGQRTNRLANHILAWTSLPVGVVTLSEQHGGREVTPQVFRAMVDDVSSMLDRFVCPDLPGTIAACVPSGADRDGRPGFHLLGTSGTVTTLAGVYLGLPRYDRRKVDGLWLSSGDVDAMLDRLLSWDFAARSANPCIGADRADLVLAGCAILEAIRKRWPAERMRVADRGLREGLLTEMMAADGAWRRSARGKRRRHMSGQTGTRG